MDAAWYSESLLLLRASHWSVLVHGKEVLYVIFSGFKARLFVVDFLEDIFSWIPNFTLIIYYNFSWIITTGVELGVKLRILNA